MFPGQASVIVLDWLSSSKSVIIQWQWVTWGHHPDHFPSTICLSNTTQMFLLLIILYLKSWKKDWFFFYLKISYFALKETAQTELCNHASVFAFVLNCNCMLLSCVFAGSDLTRHISTLNVYFALFFTLLAGTRELTSSQIAHLAIKLILNLEIWKSKNSLYNDNKDSNSNDRNLCI